VNATGHAAARHRWTRLDLVVVLASLLLAAAESRIWNDFDTRCYGGGLGDPGQHAWALTSETRQLLREPWRPFEGNAYYPSHDSVLFGDPLLGPALLVLPVRVFSADPVLLYNLAVLLSLTLASVTSYRLACALWGDRRAALLAVVAVPYSAQQMARLVHLNLLAIGFFPLVVLALLRLFETRQLRYGVLAGVAFALQAGTSGYHAFSAALVALIVVGMHARRTLERRVATGLLVAGMLAAVLLLPYLLGFAALRAEAHMEREASIAGGNALDLLGLFTSQGYLWGRVLPRGSSPFFPGLGVLLLAGWALRDWRRLFEVRLMLAIATGAFLLALGPEVRLLGRPLMPGPFAGLVRIVPLLDAMRHPFSFAVPGVMALGLLACHGLARSGLGRHPLGVALVLALALGETAADAPARLVAGREVPEIYRWFEQQPPGAVLELPFEDELWTWWAAWHHLPIVNGVGAFEPRRYQALWQRLQHDWKRTPGDQRWRPSLEFLKSEFPIRYVLLHAGAPEFMRRSAAETRSLTLLHANAAGDRVYALERDGTGPLLERAFREDQLQAGRLTAMLRGSASVSATFNDQPLGTLALGQASVVGSWTLARYDIRRGLNWLRLESSDGSDVELLTVSSQ
jgi:hypothetical protein